MAKKQPTAITLRDVNLLFRNFRGAEQFNKRGDRNFSVDLTGYEDMIDDLLAMGYNVKQLNPKTPEDTGTYILRIKVNFNNKPPKIQQRTANSSVMLDEKTVGTLDWAEIEKCDLTFTPYEWSMPNGQSGTTAYLKNMFITIYQDELELEYAEIDSQTEEIPFGDK